MVRYVLVIAAVTACAVTARGASPCEKADQLRSSGDFVKARATYQALIKEACASRGLLALVDATWRAERLITAGDIAQANGATATARRAYLDAVALNPTSKTAMDKLAAINGYATPTAATPDTASKTNSPIESAQALLKVGLRDKALEVIDGAMKANPPLSEPEIEQFGKVWSPYREAEVLAAAGISKEAITATKDAAKSGKAIPPDLAALAADPEPEPQWWLGLKHFASRYAEPAAFLLILVLLALFVRTRLRRRLEIAEFVASDATATYFAPSMSEMVRESLARLTPSKPRFSIATARDAVQPPQLPDVVTSAIPTLFAPLVRMLPEVAQQLGRGRLLRLEGRVHAPSTDRGVGLTLTLTTSGKTSSVTMWQREFDPAAFREERKADSFSGRDYYRLAQPAAIWLLFQLAEVRR